MAQTKIVGSEDLKKTLARIRPVSIAVAYVGKEWKTYLAKSRTLKEIVVSPTTGSNPKAIRQIIRRIGIDNVYFLDELHAKIYLGTKAALVGSCNLSDNGLSGHGLEEAAVFLEHQEDLMALGAIIARYKAMARQAYPRADDKTKRLKALQIEWDSKPHNGRVVVRKRKVPALRDYPVNAPDRIHIAWSQPDDNVRYNLKVIRRQIPEAKGVPIDKFFSDAMYFAEQDDFQSGDWILCWSCRDDGYPRKNGDVSWMFVHAVITNGVKDKKYPQLVGEIKGQSKPSEPFLLDASTKARIRECLCLPMFSALRSPDEEMWCLEPADAVVSKFLQRVSKESKIKGRRHT